MKRLADRRTILLAAASVAAVATGALAGGAGAETVTVTIGYEGGKAIPKGRLAVYLEGAEGRQSMAAMAQTESDGGSRAISLALPLPPGADPSLPRQIVAELQRADGWLLARGSAQADAGQPVPITLYIVMY